MKLIQFEKLEPDVKALFRKLFHHKRRPNNRLQVTANSLRSYLAAAIGGA